MSLVSAPTVFAADEDEEDVQKITVTGSRIQRTDIETASPIQITSSEEIALSGFTRIEDLMNSLPQVVTGQTAFISNGASGTANLDLRGMGSARTLVLVNGRRLQPGGVYSQSPDVNQIPAALVERVEVMTGGGSATYGADAVAGVVNFVMKDDFEGVEATFGVSGYQHNNDNTYIQGLMDLRDFEYPDGSDGIDGKTYNFDLTMGGSFADGKGHATVYATYRKVNELRQGARDYASCALNGAGTACGGSANAIIPNFDMYPIDPISGATVYGYAQYVEGDAGYDDSDGADNTIYGPGGHPGYYDDSEIPVFNEYLWANAGQGANMWNSIDSGSNFIPSPGSNRYNYAPVNHFMRPDQRYTLGAFVEYEVSDQFRPYLEVSYMQDTTRAQIAESGTFFSEEYTMDCDSPLLTAAQQAQSCGAWGLSPDDTFAVYIGKRNVEGGPRVSLLDHNSFRIVFGSDGEINDNWVYDASVQFGATSSTAGYINDFFAPRIATAIGSDGQTCDGDCVPYEVFTYNGVTSDQANLLTGVAILTGLTKETIINGYVSGTLDATLPSAEDSISVVFGTEFRDLTFERITDEVFDKGLLLGQGGPTKGILGGYDVSEFFTEASIPLVQGASGIDSLTLELGYRYSDYSTSGGESTYKVGIDYNPTPEWKIRASYNRAVRAPNVAELFSTQSMGLWTGVDPCAGVIDSDDDTISPSASLAECANTGVSAAQYGSVAPSPAGQYGGQFGGNPDLQPEIADTITFGFVANPIENLNFSVDYYSISLEGAIGNIGPELIVEQCAETGLATFCDAIQRGPTGNLWLGTSAFVTDYNVNLGERNWEGIDVSANYKIEVGGGTLNANLIGSLMQKKEYVPFPEIPSATYDCAGIVSTNCFAQPDWRHSLNVSYTQGDFWTVSAKWRYFGKVDYDGSTDTLIADGLDAQSYLDLKAAFDVSDTIGILVGVNNIMDKEPPLVGGTIGSNGNTVAGFYDTLGRYLHASVTFKF